MIAVLVILVGGLDKDKPTNAEEIPTQDIQKISCSRQEFGEYWAMKNSAAFPTAQAGIDFFAIFRYCKPHGAIELLPYKDENNQCSLFDCKCSSGNLLKEPLSEKYYCKDINLRDLGFCSQSQFVEDYIVSYKGGGLANKFVDANGNFKSDEEICRTSTTGTNLYFFTDGGTRTCTNPICLTTEQYNKAKNDLEFLY